MCRVGLLKEGGLSVATEPTEKRSNGAAAPFHHHALVHHVVCHIVVAAE